MRLVFGDFELEPAAAELRKNGELVPMEKQAFDLLVLLADNAERVLSKDEIIEKIWDGRFVSDSAVSTAIKMARRAVDDDGARQTVIKTVHGRGFRFVASVRRVAEASVQPEDTHPKPVIVEETPSIAVLPFPVLGEGAFGPAIGDAIPAELISALSRLRWLFVTSRGSSFRFRDPATTPETLREMLGVRYVLTGNIEMLGDMLTVSTELVRTDSGAVIWSSRYATDVGGIHDVRGEIVSDAVSAMEIHIPFNEARMARSLDPSQIGAWSHFHLGLQHLYRFNQPDNVIAADHFKQALEIEPEFARAHAGLSFTHWQTAFLHFGDDRAVPLAQAAESAERANAIDPHDPFANYNMARVHWLRGDVDAFAEWLGRALTINPNFAQGTYSMALASGFTGRTSEAQEYSSRAMQLSPLDPLKYAMLSVHAKALIGEGDFAKAADLTEKACHLPGAHFYIDLIAAGAHQLAGNLAQATERAQVAKERNPGVSAQMFFTDFPYRQGVDARRHMERALNELGF
ncbi:MAG: transcriptional regulator [Silicimonas sp.]|nr:transcriptional regulator [Silicimonas sp.]